MGKLAYIALGLFFGFLIGSSQRKQPPEHYSTKSEGEVFVTQPDPTHETGKRMTKFRVVNPDGFDRDGDGLRITPPDCWVISLPERNIFIKPD